MKLKFKPRPAFKPFLLSDKRWSAIVAHRRAGKTVACIQKLIKRAAESTRKEPRFAFIGPTYQQIKDVVWLYLKGALAPVPGIVMSESELSVTFSHNGARIRLYGAENYDRLRGLYLDGVIIDEAGDIDPRAWGEVIRPALSDRQGWATFIGTPKGRNEFWRITERAKADNSWYFKLLKASETGLIPDSELADARKMLTPEQYAQEYECSFQAAVKGAFYAKEIAVAEESGRITRVAHDRAADTYASWDLGIGDKTAIWVFQIIGGGEWHYIDFYEASDEPLSHFVDWVKDRKYRIDEHFLPHDAESRELQTGKSRTEFLSARDLNCTVLRRHSDADRIEAARVRFNRMWFDAERCEKGIDCLRMYRAEFDDKRGVAKTRALHDWASHAADAFGYGVIGAEEMQNTQMPSYEFEGVV